jgi:hypothetical protein
VIDEFDEAAVKSAFDQMIASARNLMPRMIAGDLTAYDEYGWESGVAAARAGLTPAEGLHYADRVLAMVRNEAHAVKH